MHFCSKRFAPEFFDHLFPLDEITSPLPVSVTWYHVSADSFKHTTAYNSVTANDRFGQRNVPSCWL